MKTSTSNKITRDTLLGIILLIAISLFLGFTEKSDASNVATGRIQDTIELIARGQAPSGTNLHLKRIRKAGTPLFWEEIISVEMDGQSRYSTLRSFVNAGGSPIGSWESPTDPGTVRELAKTLIQLKLWDFPSTPIAPGGEEIKWELAVEDMKVILFTRGDPNTTMKLSPLDVQLRRIANNLVASKNGAALNIQLLVKRVEKMAEVQVALINESNMDFQIQNPFISSNEKINFLQVELGEAPVEVPGVTNAGIVYRPLMLPSSEILPEPWDQDNIVLKAGTKIICPFQLQIDLLAQRNHFLRATYSHYGNTSSNPDLPLVRGRVFTNELKLK
jgi:hypothetical protein